ncbi:MAG TPA: hypothetical protein VF549_08965 [Solirubrobacteraceae bacterium]
MSAPVVERPAPRAVFSAPAAVSRGRVARWLPWVVLLAIMAGSAWLLMWAGRGTTFFYDDWPYILERGNWNPDTLLRPHNEHLQVFPLLLYKILFETVGLHAHWVYRLALVVLNLLTGLLLFLYARRRVGDWPAVALAACLIVMAPSWYNLLYSFQVNFVGAMAAGMGALVALDREDRRGDLIAMVLLGVVLGSSSVGFPFVIGAVIELVWRRDWRRLWVVGVPIAFYGLWWLGWHTGSSLRLHNAPAIPGYMMDGADDSAGAITGYGVDFGLVIFCGLVALVVRELLDPERVTARLVAVISLPLTMWALTALGRADMGVEADANRYLYASGLFVALVGLEVARRYAIVGRAAAAVAVFLFVGAIANANAVKGGGEILRGWSEGGIYAVTAYEIAGPENVAYDYGGGDPTQGFIKAGPVFEAIKRYGSSPGYTAEELRDQSPERKRGVDHALARTLNLNVAAVSGKATAGAAAPVADGKQPGNVVAAGAGCVRLEPAVPEAAFNLRLPLGGATFHAGSSKLEVRLRRFSTLFFEEPLGTVAAGTTGSLAIPRDRSSQPWFAQIHTSDKTVVCGLAT